MRRARVPLRALGTGLTVTSAVTGGVLALMGTSAASSERAPSEDRAAAVEASLLTPAQARHATGFTATLAADLMAGPQGRSCYQADDGLTCDAWFTAEQTARAYPVGASITVTGSPADARAALARLAAKVPHPDRPGDRVLASTATLLAAYATGLAVGPDLRPAVTVTVQQVHGSLITMGTCQVQQRRARLSALRSCADRLQSAQAGRAAALVDG